MSDKGGQQVGPSVGTFARLKQENRDMKLHADRCEIAWNTAVQEKGRLHAECEELQAEVDRLKKEAFDYRDGFMETSAELEHLRELLKAAENIEGPASWFAPVLLTPVKRLHKAIRKVRGMG